MIVLLRILPVVAGLSNMTPGGDDDEDVDDIDEDNDEDDERVVRGLEETDAIVDGAVCFVRLSLWKGVLDTIAVLRS